MKRFQTLGAKAFRPFFLLAGVHAAVMAPLWLLVLEGRVPLSGPLPGVTWHAHEMLFGFATAVIAGFLLTAAESWTGRPTLRGPALLALAAVWLAARVCLVVGPGWLGAWLDLAVIPGVVLGLAPALVAARSTRNLPFLGLLTALWLANGVVYLDAAGQLPGAAALAHRTAVYLVAVIMLIVSGRVVPMFTRNATGQTAVRNLPRLDQLAIGATAGVALLQVVSVPALLPWLAAIAGIATLARTRHWGVAGTVGTPLLWVLHLGHAAIGLGLLLLAGQRGLGAPGSAPLHAITVGGIGLLTVGMMARVSLGHTGRPLRVGRGVAVAFTAVAAALVVRVFGPWLLPGSTPAMLWVSALAWALGFALFVGMSVPILLAPRVDGKAG